MIYLDGIIYSLQRHGGINVYFDTLIEAIRARGLPYKLLLHDDIGFDGPHVIAPKRPLERYRRAPVPADARVFVSSYYRNPSRRDVPSVVTVHDFVYEAVLSGLKVHVHSRQKFTALRRASDLICISEATRQDLLRYFGQPKGRLHMIHNGVSDAFRVLPDRDDHRGYLLYVGKRHRYKNFRLLVEMLPHLPPLDLVCVGGEPWSEDERHEVEQALSGDLRVEQGIDEARLNLLYNEAAALVYTSIYEGFGIPVIEAMRAGCPVVAAPCAAVAEAGGPGLLTPDQADPQAMAALVRQCLEPAARARLIATGLDWAAGFSWDKTHRATVDILEQHL